MNRDRPRQSPVLLAFDAVIRIAARDRRPDHRFSRTIGLRDRIVAARTALVLDVDRRAKVREDRVAGGESGAQREFRERLVGLARSSRGARWYDRSLGIARGHYAGRGTIDTPASFSCASIREATYLSPKPSAFAVTRL